MHRVSITLHYFFTGAKQCRAPGDSSAPYLDCLSRLSEMPLSVHKPLCEFALSQRIVRRDPRRSQSICAREKGTEGKGKNVSLKYRSAEEVTQVIDYNNCEFKWILQRYFFIEYIWLGDSILSERKIKYLDSMNWKLSNLRENNIIRHQNPL